MVDFVKRIGIANMLRVCIFNFFIKDDFGINVPHSRDDSCFLSLPTRLIDPQHIFFNDSDFQRCFCPLKPADHFIF